jgi:hypothetical protein
MNVWDRFKPTICDVCMSKHTSESRYRCTKCKKLLCAAMTHYIYKDDTLVYVNEAVEKTVSNCCNVDITKCITSE